MAKLQDFIDYLHQQVQNHSIYVWGGQGEGHPTITESWIRKMETSTAYANRAIAFWKKQVAAGYGKVLKAFDCSGLGMYWLKNTTGVYGSDMSSGNMRAKCTALTKTQLKRGDWVFRLDSKGSTYHIGYVVDGALNVIEAKGRDDGVVKRGLNANGTSYWNAFGRPEVFKKEIEEGGTTTLNGWKNESGLWYFYRSGKRVTGWLQDAGKWYYLEPAMAIGWRKLKWSGGEGWFYFNASGAMVTGRHYLDWNGNKDWYFFDERDGNMLANVGNVAARYDGSGRLVPA